jgi:HEPN domain-containing protein
MGNEKSTEEARRWFQTAESDLETARVLHDNRRYAHACFHAQQAAEKAVKSIWYLRAGDPWGHSVQRLIDDLRHFDAGLFENVRDLLPVGSKLDKYYIPTRYPNGLPDLVPDLAYFEDDASTAIALSEKLIERIRSLITIQ